MSFTVRQRDVSIWDSPSQAWVDVRTLGTDVGVFVGASSRDIRLNGTLPANPNGYGTGAGNSDGNASTTATESTITPAPYVTQLGDGQVESPATSA